MRELTPLEARVMAVLVEKAATVPDSYPLTLNALQYLFPLPNTGAPNAISNNYSLNLPVPISL